MADLLIYSIKASIALLFFFLVYKLICSRNTFFRINRLCILLFYVSSLFIFLIPLKTETFSEVHQVIAGYEEVLLATEVAPTDQIFVTETTDGNTLKNRTVTGWADITGIIYVGGVLFVLLRDAYSVTRILFIIRRSVKKKMNGVCLFVADKDIPSFSWMRYIIMSRKDYNENREIILTHELSHVRNRHSLDLFISELFILFQWYNPTAWLFRRELRDVHEFEADNNVLRSGIDAKTYQILLIKKAAGSQHLTFMTNSFNHSKLEKRITMMLKENNNPYAKLKYLLLVPAFAIAVSVFARPRLISKIDELSEVESTEKITHTQNSNEAEATTKAVDHSQKSADQKNKSTDPSDTIDLKKYRVEAYRNGKRVNFNQWKDFERKDGNILISTDSARYYKGDKMLGWTIGGTVHISENTENLDGGKIQRLLIAGHAIPYEKQTNMIDAAGGRDGFLNSIDLKKYRVEVYRDGERINFDEWENFRVETYKKKIFPNGFKDPQEEGDYIVIDADSTIFYKGQDRLGGYGRHYQFNLLKRDDLSGEKIQRGLISSFLLEKRIDPNEQGKRI